MPNGLSALHHSEEMLTLSAVHRSRAVGAEAQAPFLLHLVSPFPSCEMSMPGPCWGRVGVDEIIERAQALPGQAWPYPELGSPACAGRLWLSCFAQW